MSEKVDLSMCGATYRGQYLFCLSFVDEGYGDIREESQKINESNNTSPDGDAGGSCHFGGESTEFGNLKLGQVQAHGTDTSK